MEKSLNRVELKGFVGYDPKINSFEDGLELVKFSLATNESVKNKEGEYNTQTIWHNIIAWSNKNMPPFSCMKKGSYIGVIGKIKPISFTTKAGVEKQTYEIVASSIKILDTIIE